ncbi:MAG: hypothetical protein KJ906_00535 [Nanoarchaeota archaeon]|nr:hypothetical protein [Nanoarchaeota archaeon]
MIIEKMALQRISKLSKNNSGIIKFPNVFYKLCSSFQIPKEQAWEILHKLSDEGYIDIVPYHGVRILNVSEHKEMIAK